MSKVMKIEEKGQEILESVLPPTEESKTTLATAEIPEGTIALQEGEQKIVDDTDPAAAAGALFALYGTRLYAAVDNLSAKQVKRLVKALCTYPLEDVFINRKIKEEHDAYLLASRMIESKFLITLQTGWEEEERRKQAAADFKAAEAAKETTEVLETNNQGDKNV